MERIKPAPCIVIDGPAPIVRVTLKARGTSWGGTKVTVRRRTHRYGWRTRSYVEGDWT